MRKVALGVVLALGLSGLTSAGGPPAGAAVPDPRYPTPFSRTASDELENAVAGTTPRRVLVITVRFDDTETFKANIPFIGVWDAVFAEKRFFDARGVASGQSAAEYYRTASQGKFTISPAPEHVGTVNDGIVEATYDGTLDEWVSGGLAMSNARSLQAAHEAGLNFADLDANHNGVLERTEITFVVVPLGGGPDATGATRAIENPDHPGQALTSIDGVALPVTTMVPQANAYADFMTTVHEMGHAMLDMPDNYGYGVGSLDLAGPTGPPDTSRWLPSAVSKLQWGWSTPSVLAASAHVELDDAASTNDSLIVYDPAHGTNEFFMLEYRSKRPNTLDENASEWGLVVWRVGNDRPRRPGFDIPRPVELVAPSVIKTDRRIQGCVDDDLDGRDREDPGAVPWAIIAGRADVNGDGVITAMDGPQDADGDGKITGAEAPSFDGIAIVGGSFDLDNDGAISSPGDTGFLGSVAVIGGGVDRDGSVTVDAADSGDPWGAIDNDNDGAKDEDGTTTDTGCYAGGDDAFGSGELPAAGVPLRWQQAAASPAWSDGPLAGIVIKNLVFDSASPPRRIGFDIETNFARPTVLVRPAGPRAIYHDGYGLVVTSSRIPLLITPLGLHETYTAGATVSGGAQGFGTSGGSYNEFTEGSVSVALPRTDAMRGSMDVSVGGQALRPVSHETLASTARDVPLRITLEDQAGTPTIVPVATTVRAADRDAGVVRSFSASGPVQVLTSDADTDPANVDVSSIRNSLGASGVECGQIDRPGVGGNRETVRVASQLRIHLTPVAGDSAIGRVVQFPPGQSSLGSHVEDGDIVVDCPLGLADIWRVQAGPGGEYPTSHRGLAYRITASYQRSETVVALGPVTQRLVQLNAVIKAVTRPLCALPGICGLVDPLLALVTLPAISLPAPNIGSPVPNLSNLKLPGLPALPALLPSRCATGCTGF
jgi:M6 family metalloprotease-like protein